MPSLSSPQVLAIAAGMLALGCALACAIAAALLVRHGRGGAGAGVRAALAPRPPRPAPPTPPSAPVIMQPLPTPTPPTIIVQMPPLPQPLAGAPLPVVAHAPHPGEQQVTQLTGQYPGLSRVIGEWMLDERDPIERIRMAHDLGTLGDGDAARALLDGVRRGQLSPSVAADQLQRGGFAAGAVVAAAAHTEHDERVAPFARHILSRALGQVGQPRT